MELSDFIEIKEIVSTGSSETAIKSAIDKVNMLLKKGWVIINTYTTCYDPIIAKEHQIMHYVLGITYASKTSQDFAWLDENK